MEEVGSVMTAPLLSIRWSAIGPESANAGASLRLALLNLKRVALKEVSGDGASADTEGMPLWVHETLAQPDVDVVCWVQDDERAQAWSFHVATKDAPSALLATSVTHILWPYGSVDDDKALQAVLQTLVLLPSLQPGCSKALLELMLDTLLHAEAWLLDPEGGGGAHVSIVLATMVTAAWLAMYRVAKQDVYVQRALDAAQAVTDVAAIDVPQWVRVAWLRAYAEALMMRGLRVQDVAILDQAAEQFGAAAELQAQLEQDEDWAAILVMQGHALESLAQMRRDEGNWSRAAQAYRLAGSVLTQGAHGERWAAVKTSLGRVLSAWGRQKRDVEVLHEAVRVLDEALLVYTEERHAAAWANGMHYSGVVLQALGQIQRDPVQLVLALQSFEKALKQRPRKQQPAAWATTKHHLASLLTQLGLEQNDSEKLRQAISGFQEAMEVRTLTTSPQDWVATQHALGRAQDALGRREQGVHAFERAIEAYILALSQRPREMAPLDWAVLQFDLGNVWLQVGYRLQQVAALQSAVTAYGAALEVFDPTQHSVQWTQASHSMAAAMRRSGELGGHVDMLQRAAELYQEVLSRQSKTLSAHDMATLVESWASCHIKQSVLRSDPEPLRQAIDVFQRHLPALDEKSAEFAQGVRKHLAQTWLSLALDHAEPEAALKSVEVASVWLNNTADPVGSPAWLKVQATLAAAESHVALNDPSEAALVRARSDHRALLSHVTRQSHPLEWATATGYDALCEWVIEIQHGRQEAPAALAVLTQVMAVLWRVDPQAAARMERAHASVQHAARHLA